MLRIRGNSELSGDGKYMMFLAAIGTTVRLDRSMGE